MNTSAPGSKPATGKSGDVAQRLSTVADPLNVTSGELLRQAIAAQGAGRLPQAESLCRQLLTREPQNLPAKHLRAIVAASQGNSPFATKLLREVLQREPTSVGALNQLAYLCWTGGKAGAAIELCNRALKSAPNLAETHDNLGMAHLSTGNHTAAADSFQRAMDLNPDLLPAHYHLAITCELQGRSDTASAIVTQASSGGQGLLDNAAASFAQTGRILQRLGRFSDATLCFQRAIALQPGRTAPYVEMLQGMKASEADRPLIAKMRERMGDPQLHGGLRANLHFALGKAHDDLSEFAEAIGHFDQANRLRRADHALDRARLLKTIEWLESRFTKEFCRRRFAGASRYETPIVIFGMPRSGTTLVEQILSRHPEISGGGELLFWGDIAATLPPNFTGFTARAAEEIALEYLSMLGAIAPGARRVTDKMPSNFFRLGLIHHLFPRARLIHCRRNPLDNCLSIYFIQFDTGHEYAYDRGDIVFYYHNYQRLMAHWRRVLPPDRMLEIDYEELVTEPETISRRMIKYCGLEWNESCLGSQVTSGSVNTASLWQARQPIYTTSRERWRNYEPWLGEFRRLLPEGAI